MRQKLTSQRYECNATCSSHKCKCISLRRCWNLDVIMKERMVNLEICLRVRESEEGKSLSCKIFWNPKVGVRHKKPSQSSAPLPQPPPPPSLASLPTLNKLDTYNPTNLTSGSLPSRNQRRYTGFPNKTYKFITTVKIYGDIKQTCNNKLLWFHYTSVFRFRL